MGGDERTETNLIHLKWGSVWIVTLKNYNLQQQGNQCKTMSVKKSLKWQELRETAVWIIPINRKTSIPQQNGCWPVLQVGTNTMRSLLPEWPLLLFFIRYERIVFQRLNAISLLCSACHIKRPTTNWSICRLTTSVEIMNIAAEGFGGEKH